MRQKGGAGRKGIVRSDSSRLPCSSLNRYLLYLRLLLSRAFKHVLRRENTTKAGLPLGAFPYSLSYHMDSNSLGGTMGPLYIGMVLAGALWGVSCVQTWYYFDNYKNDPTFLRVVVFCTWLSDTIHQILISQVVYNYTITHFGDIDNLQNVLWSLYLEALFNGITGFLVQSFFLHRIWTCMICYSCVILFQFLASPQKHLYYTCYRSPCNWRIRRHDLICRSWHEVEDVHRPQAN